MTQLQNDILDAVADWVTTESNAWTEFQGVEEPAYNQFVDAEATARGIAQGLIDGANATWL